MPPAGDGRTPARTTAAAPCIAVVSRVRTDEARRMSCKGARRNGVRSKAGKDQGAVGAAESERVRQGGTDLHPARGVGHVVQVALRIGIIEIDRGRGNLVADRKRAGDRLDSAGGTEQVPVIDLVEFTATFLARSPSNFLTWATAGSPSRFGSKSL